MADDSDQRIQNQPQQRIQAPGRGSSLPIANRFEQIQIESDLEQLEPDDQIAELSKKVKTEYFTDESGTIVSQNNSPDVDFRFSLNPYRGCAHGCSYCYARPRHEYLGFNAVIDFESKIIIKPDAPRLFKKWLSRRSWKSSVEPIVLSGVTDCYQPCEKKHELTRQCLEIALDARQPMRITTKNAMVRRDVDILSEMAKLNLICVTISVSSLDQSLIKIMEPRSSSPAARLDAISVLAQAGVPVKVLAAPVIPAVNDEEIPEILRAVSKAGATIAGYVMLRLPLAVEPVFLDWVDRHFPDRLEKITGRLKSLGDGKLYDSEFKSRMKGKGIWAQQIGNLFATICLTTGLKRSLPKLDCDSFRGCAAESGRQMDLF